MNASLTNNNRINVPAVCRLRNVRTNRTVGSAVLVAPGLLLTSSVAVPSPPRASSLVATFFEGTKKTPINVKLEPLRYYFASRYPAAMDYCLVACEEAPLINVVPVRIGLTRKEWAFVEEGDMLLIIEHPIGDVAGAADASTRTATSISMLPVATDTSYDPVQAPYLEQKRFEEVLRCRGEVCFLKSNGSWMTAGCPAFNENGQLVGLQSQSQADGEGIVNRVLSLISIVKHLFANVQLPHLPQVDITFQDVWDTWYVTNDITRIIAIFANFKGKAMAQQVTHRLCDLTANPELVKSIAANGGIEVILKNLSLFRTEETLAEAGLRALWNVSIGEDAHLAMVSEMEGVSTIIDVVESFPVNETVLQLSAVLLHNIIGCQKKTDFPHADGVRALAALYPGFQKFRGCVVLQKFALSFFSTLVRLNEDFARRLIQLHIMEHVIHIIEENTKHIFLMEMVVSFLAELAQYPQTMGVACTNVVEYGAGTITYLISLLINLILEYKDLDSVLLNGNRALWGLGNVPACRAIILENPRGTDALRISLPALTASIHR